MNEVIQLNTEKLSTSIDKISAEVSAIEDDINRFSQLLTEKNEATHGKFNVLKTLSGRMEEQKTKLNAMNGALDEILHTLNSYIERAEEAQDTTGL